MTAVEPLPLDSPLVGLEEVLLTGHSAYFSREANAELTRRVVEAVLAALRGEVPPGLVNPEVLRHVRSRPGAVEPASSEGR